MTTQNRSWPWTGATKSWTDPGLGPLLEPGICLGGIEKMVVWELSSKGGPDPLEPRICMGGIKKMVVWELSSKGAPHP